MRLTPAMKRAILALDGSKFVDYAQVMKRVSTRMALTNGGITEPERNGVITLFFRIRLTAVGLAIKERLTP